MKDLEKLDTSQLETAAAAVVGQIVFALSRLEFNLGLYLRNAVGGSDVDAVNPLIARLSFKSKIDALREVVEHKFASNDECLSEFRLWCSAIDGYRAKRNSFVHGRWGMHLYGQEVINVASGLPNTKPQKETRYSLADLERELSAANQIVASFDQWITKWTR